MIEEQRGGPQQQQQGMTLEYFQQFPAIINQLNLDQKLGQEGYFHQNSLVLVQHVQGGKFQKLLYMPVYIRTHFRNMTEMDIQNLSCKFIATMNIDFYLGKHSSQKKSQQVIKFAEAMHELLKDKLKITFQNDFVVNMEEDLSSNVSDSDRLLRAQLVKYECENDTRIYSNFQITREFKFGLHSDIFFFPLEQNNLDLVTTINAIKTKIKVRDPKSKERKQQSLVIRFNCMNLQLGENLYEKRDRAKIDMFIRENATLVDHLKELYMVQNTGKELDDQTLIDEFILNRNHPFFRDIKISFPLKKNATQFGYYQIIEKDVMAFYTRQKQLQIEQTCYQRLKNCLFCKKKILNYDQTDQYKEMQEGANKIFSQTMYQKLPSQQDRSKEESFCNVIMSIPLLKASLGSIIQLCIPIFFLSFITLVEFLYSTSSSLDQIRGFKIGASTLIVATYISFIYAMRSVIPPTPSWSLFQMAVCLLAVSCLFPIIEVIYQSNINDLTNPFLDNDLFIVSFCINSALCMMIVVILVVISIYKWIKIKRHRSLRVKMGNLIDSLTQKYFHLWRNYRCKEFMIQELNYLITHSKTCVVSDR